jgi:acetyltransferase-like isoleucine patch superfamily enzyme
MENLSMEIYLKKAYHHVRKILFIVEKIISSIIYLFIRVRYVFATISASGVVFIGKPVIRLKRKSRLTIGKNVVIVSRKYANPLGLNKRTTITTMNKGAEIIIKDNVGMSGTVICCGKRIIIGNNVGIGANVTIVDTDLHNFMGKTEEEFNNPELIPMSDVIIEDNVKISMNVTILKGVTIGENSVIAANSLVITDIPPNVLAGGSPAKVIKKIR